MQVPEGAGCRELDPRVLLQQIGRMNVLAVSGGRVTVLQKEGEPIGIELPVGHGYRVRVWLDASDTYIVQRVWRDTVKGEETWVYCDQVGDAVYRAGMYQNVPFGAHAGAMA